MTEELEQLLKNLKLRRILEIYDEQLRAADKDDISYSEFVTRLVRAQFQARQEGALEWRIGRANLPERWTLETFPFARQPGVNRKQIRGFAELEFIAKAENIVFHGNTGGDRHSGRGRGCHPLRSAYDGVKELWKCRGCGKRGKPKAGFPLFPRAPWESRHKAARFPHSHSSDDEGGWKSGKRKARFPLSHRPESSLQHLTTGLAGGLSPSACGGAPRRALN